MAGGLAPQHPPVWQLAGLRARSSGRLGDAMRDLGRAVALVPANVNALDQLVWCRQLAGDVTATATTARAPQEAAPAPAELHAYLILPLPPRAATTPPPNPSAFLSRNHIHHTPY